MPKNREKQDSRVNNLKRLLQVATSEGVMLRAMRFTMKHCLPLLYAIM